MKGPNLLNKQEQVFPGHINAALTSLWAQETLSTHTAWEHPEITFNISSHLFQGFSHACKQTVLFIKVGGYGSTIFGSGGRLHSPEDGGLIPISYSAHAEVSLGNWTLNPKWPLMAVLAECEWYVTEKLYVCQVLYECVLMGECDFYCNALWEGANTRKLLHKCCPA